MGKPKPPLKKRAAEKPVKKRAAASRPRAARKAAAAASWYLSAAELAHIGVDDPARPFAQMLIDEPAGHCRWVHLAVRRHCADLAHAARLGEKSPYIYSARKARRPIEYATRFSVYAGEQVGKPLTMLPWQQFVVAQLYGWRLSADPRKRRYNYAYIAVPRKNGKTGLVAPLGLFHMSHPPRGGQVQVFSVATKEDQAKIVWKDAETLLRHSTLLREGRFRIRHKHLTHIKSDSEWRPLGSDSTTLDGLRPDLAIMDELHAWKRRELWDVITSAFGAAFSPLILQITTAGDNTECLCTEQEARVTKVLETVQTGTYTFEASKDASSYFGAIWTIDPADKWHSPKAWAKANPSLGIIKSREDMERLAEAAKHSPGARREFLIKHLNHWQATGAQRWLDPEKWAQCYRPHEGQARRGKAAATPIAPLPPESSWERLRGQRVYCGLDLSATTDTSAFCVLSEEQAQGGGSGGASTLAAWRFWLPDDDIARRTRRDNVPYDLWAREGYLTLTPGEVVDIGQIEADILGAIEKYELDVQLFAADPWRMQGLGQRLSEEHGLPVHLLPQSYAAMTEPLNELERLVLSARLDHGGHPIATAHAHAARLKVVGANAARLIDKSQSAGRIDGLAALAIALGARLHAQAEGLESATPMVAST